MKLVLFFLCFAHVYGSLPGFKTTLSLDGLNYARQVGVALLEQSIPQLQIPDITGSTGTPIGTIQYQLSNIVLHSLRLPDSTIELIPNEGITLQINGMSCSLSLEWHYRANLWPHTSDSGTADVTITGTNAVVSVQLTSNNSLPHLNVLASSVNIGSLHVDLHGGASWLYQVFIDAFSRSITKNVQDTLAQAIATNMNVGANAAFDTAPIYQNVSPTVEFDLGLVGNPVFTNAYTSFWEKGEFYQISSQTECPGKYCGQYYLPDAPTNEMLQMIISEYVANSATYAFFLGDQLQINVTDADIPTWSPIRLNTKDFSQILPALYQEFPNMEMQITALCATPPSSTFSKAGATIDANSDLEFYAILPNGTLELAFVLAGNMTASAEAMLEGTVLYSNFTYMHGYYYLEKTNIGEFDVKVLDQLLNLLLSAGVIPALNNELKPGFALPTIKGTSFVNPTLKWANHYFYISTNISYTPPGFTRGAAVRII